MTSSQLLPRPGVRGASRAATTLLAFLFGTSCGGTAANGDSPTAPTAPAADQRASHPGEPAHEHHFESAEEAGGHGHGGPLGHRFENADEWAARWEGPQRDTWQRPEHVIELMAIEPGMTVADLGTGTGYFVPHLARAVGPEGSVLALDIEQSMVDHVTARAAREGLANVAARRVAFDHPGLAPGTADRVLCVNTWHHIPGRIAYARKLRDGMAEGGALFIVDFTLDGDHGPPRQSRIAPEAAIAELRAAGFDAEIVPSSLPEQYVVKGTR